MKIHSQPMDLRDHFATAAMQGMVATISSQFELDRMRGWAKKNGQTLSQFIASDSYKQADAMIAEREKGTVESIDSIKHGLVIAIGHKYPDLEASIHEAADQLIYKLETGLPY
ncbi:hypothetical protein Q5M79_06270 [Acinetobacter baumannii]|nr:hypothetical protein [Acinetobacter baumannii]